MGKGILIVVLGVSVIISILIMNLNANVHQGLDTTLNFYNNSQARLIANSGIEIYFSKMRNDKYLKGVFNNNSLMNGEYDINIYGNDDSLIIRSVSTYDNVIHTSVASAKRRPVSIPKIHSALYVSSDNMDLNLNGNVDIDGNDYYMNGTPNTAGTPLPGVAVDTPPDSAFIINNVKPKITNDFEGAGGAPSVKTVNNTTDWLGVTEDFIYSADTVLGTGTYAQGSFGTVTEPIITYCNGDVDFTNSVGYGVMVINGNVNLSGNFNFYGIVIVYGTSTIRTQTIGNNAIFGATILVGETVEIQSQGNSQFWYSSQAIENAKMNLKSSRFEITSWWE